ncbi:mitogen-activated protein kinase, putative [Bodo saltans]|uniref:Mitogen-activated protein kinase, putative n=1 Tax=Bodo saltans TaxID=75058 RepID=A0A0S4JGG0_BODSA|nr:mitogen-activated protein kinase, putative [Bodo saltans]|eukprot:CUG90639.1 mitogen-activated protein kinase, putative [Bodo saltans]
MAVAATNDYSQDDSDEAVKARSCKEKAVDIVCSLKFAMGVVIFVVAVVCTIVSFVPLYVEASRATEALALDYMVKVSSDVNQSASAYFRTAQGLVTNTIQSYRLGAFNGNDTTSVVKWLAYGATVVDQITLIFDLPNPLWTGSYVSPNYDIAPSGAFYAVEYNATYGNVSLINMTTLAVLQNYGTATIVPFRSRAYYPIIRNHQSWGSSFIGTSLRVNESVLPCGAPLVGGDGVSVGAVYVRTRYDVIEQYLYTLTIATNGLAMIFDPVDGNLVASSSPLDPNILFNGTTYSIPKYTDRVDPMLRRVVDALGTALATCPVPCTATVGSGANSIYVMVTVVNDTYNLNKRLVVAIPSSDFLQRIRDATEVSLILAAVCGVVLVILGVCAVMLVAAPLDNLTVQLKNTKHLRGLDDETGPRSAMTEIRSIENAFEKLRVELKKMRSFLPESILQFVGDTASDEDSTIFMPSLGVPVDDDDEASLKAATSEGELEAAAPARRRRRNLIQDSLNMEFVLVTRRVTVVITNFRGFHNLLKLIGPSDLHRFHSELLSATLEVAKRHLGVTHGVSGDHFTFSWNAASHRRTHISAAMRFVRDMQVAMRTPPPELRHVCPERSAPSVSTLASEYAADRTALKMSFGLATGPALCGNFGCESLKQPGIVGPVVQQAFALVHQCTSEQTVALVNEEASNVVDTEFSFLHWNYVVLPHDEHPTLISVLLGATPPLPEEDIDAACLTNEKFRRYVNAAFNAFQQGRFRLARKLIAAAQEAGGPTWMSEGIQRALNLVEPFEAASRSATNICTTVRSDSADTS